MISIIIPVYNADEYLDRCVESVVNQTYQNLEIILLDDGSPDRSPQICDAWAERDHRVRVIHKQNSGVADTRNWGLREARGGYIAFVDADDWILPVMMEKLKEALEQYDADIAICQFAYVYANGYCEVHTRKKDPAVEVLSTQTALELLLEGTRVTNHLWRYLYRRAVIPLEIFPFGKLYEDIHAIYQIFLNCQKIVCLNTAYYFYRQTPGGITQTRSIAGLLDYRHILETRRKTLLKAMPELRPAIEGAEVYETFEVLIVLKQSRETGPKRDALHSELMDEISKMNSRQIRRAAMARRSCLFKAYVLLLKLFPWSERLSDRLLFFQNARFFHFIKKLLRRLAHG